MNLHILPEQANEPAVQMLGQIHSLSPLPGDTHERQFPLVVLGIAWQTQQPLLARLCQETYRGVSPLLLLPPWPQHADLTQMLNTPARVAIVPGRNDQIKLEDADLLGSAGQQNVQVRCDQVLDTPPTAGVLARNSSGQPVLIRYRPDNTATPIYITTVQLLAHSSRSDVLGRKNLLLGLLQLLEASVQKKHKNEPTPQHSVSPTRDELRVVVLALSRFDAGSRQGLRLIILEKLYTDLADDRMGLTLQYLENAGCIHQDGVNFRVNAPTLNEWISRLNLFAFVRALEDS